MIKITIKDTRSCSIKTYGERVRKGDNRIASLLIEMPECFGEYNRGSCSVAMKCHVTEGVITYNLRTDSSTALVPITTDITDRKQVVRIDFVITHSGNVIGTTNTVKLEVLDAPDNGEPLTPREQFDAVIREQRVTIEEQSATITEQAGTISSQGEQITELNGEVSTLEGTVAEQQTTITRQNTTIDELNERRIPVYIEPQLVPKEVTPQLTNQYIEPSEGKNGFNAILVNPITSDLVPNCEPQNIAKGKTILGVTGTFDSFPENPVGGIYFYEPDENDNPTKCKIYKWKAQNFFSEIITSKNYPFLKEVLFDNCNITTIAKECFRDFRSIETVILNEGVEDIADRAFLSCSNLKSVVLSTSLRIIGSHCFEGDSALTGRIVFSNNLQYINNNAFYGTSLQEVTIPSGGIDSLAFYSCTSLYKLVLGNGISGVHSRSFELCRSLKDLTLETGFNCNNLNVSASTRFSAETIVACLEALADRTGQTAYTITFGTTNLNKLTAEQRAIATNKNWNLA